MHGIYYLIVGLAIVAWFAGCDRDGDGKVATEVKVDTTIDGKTEGQLIDDEKLTKGVERALKDSEAFKFPDVVVTTHKGEIQLSGFVATREQKDAAGDIAKRLANGRNVDNKIEVKK